jgi:hypothetical protein
MTALQNFLKQIVLKQVDGSVYLVPTICDFQIDEALEEERKQGQNQPISNVSHQRELLLVFAKWMEEQLILPDKAEQVVEQYLDSE